MHLVESKELMPGEDRKVKSSPVLRLLILDTRSQEEGWIDLIFVDLNGITIVTLFDAAILKPSLGKSASCISANFPAQSPLNRST